MTEKFTDLEKKVFSNFLDQLQDHMSNSSCNDYQLPNDEEGKNLFLKAATLAIGEKEANLSYKLNSKNLICMDSWLLGYLRQKLETIL
jgi:hypothetical protein